MGIEIQKIVNIKINEEMLKIFGKFLVNLFLLAKKGFNKNYNNTYFF